MLIRNFETTIFFCHGITIVIWEQNIDVIRDFAICPENIIKFGGNYGH